MTKTLSRSTLKVLLPLMAISIFAVGSFAASVSVTSTTYEAQNGVYFNINGGFTAVSDGFSVVQTTGATSSPCTWANGGTCQTAVTAGDWQYSVALTITASAATSHVYTVSVTWNTGSGYTSMGSVTVQTLSSITPSQTMTFVFDTSTTTFSAPAGIVVTVA
jgi:hypothetical protein